MSNAKDESELVSLMTVMTSVTHSLSAGTLQGNNVDESSPAVDTAKVLGELGELLEPLGIDRLRAVESARKSSEDFYKCHRKPRNSANVGLDGDNVVERLSSSKNKVEILFIMKHFQESSCAEFKQKSCESSSGEVCANCGLTIDFHGRENEAKHSGEATDGDGLDRADGNNNNNNNNDYGKAVEFNVNNNNNNNNVDDDNNQFPYTTKHRVGQTADTPEDCDVVDQPPAAGCRAATRMAALRKNVPQNNLTPLTIDETPEEPQSPTEQPPSTSDKQHVVDSNDPSAGGEPNDTADDCVDGAIRSNSIVFDEPDGPFVFQYLCGWPEFIGPDKPEYVRQNSVQTPSNTNDCDQLRVKFPNYADDLLEMAAHDAEVTLDSSMTPTVNKSDHREPSFAPPSVMSNCPTDVKATNDAADDCVDGAIRSYSIVFDEPDGPFVHDDRCGLPQFIRPDTQEHVSRHSVQTPYYDRDQLRVEWPNYARDQLDATNEMVTCQAEDALDCPMTPTVETPDHRDPNFTPPVQKTDCGSQREHLGPAVGIFAAKTATPPRLRISGVPRTSSEEQRGIAGPIGPASGADVQLNRGLQTTTFGALLIPSRFVGGTATQLDQPCFKRYVRCNGCSPKVAEDVYFTLRNYWNIERPSVIFSVLGGQMSTRSNSRMKNRLSSIIRKLIDVTGGWIITDGRNDGASRYLGQLLVERRTADNEDNDGDDQQLRSKPVLLGVSHWGSIERNELMLGVTLPSATNGSKYFISLEHRIAEGPEKSSVLNPFQSAYVFIDNGKLVPEDCVEKFRQKLDGLKSDKSDVNPSFVTVTVVLGGDDKSMQSIIEQVRRATVADHPVIVFREGSNAAELLANVHSALEDEVPRSWNNDEELNVREMVALEKSRHSHYPRYEHWLREHETLRDIMRKRYLITIVDCERCCDDKPFEDLCIRILRNCYRGCTRRDRIKAALKSCSPELLRATFCREENEIDDISSTTADVENGGTGITSAGNGGGRASETNENLITFLTLHLIQLNNISAYDSMGKTLKWAYKRQSFSRTQQEHVNILPVIGRILHRLMGPRFTILYHDKPFLEFSYERVDKDHPYVAHGNEALVDKNGEAFHLLLWSVLGNKPALTHFFILQTTAPLGAALIASMLYSRLACWAQAISEEELRRSLEFAAGRFETMAIEILVRLYEKDPEDAYRVLICQLPFDLGPYVTPLVVADDAKAMEFMSHDCCQTFLQRVWKGNMAVDTESWKMMFFMLPWPVIRRIFFYDSSLSPPKGKSPDELEAKYELNEDGTEKGDDSDKHTDQDELPVSLPYKLKYYYEAPVTKFFTSMIFYLCYLGLLSYFVVTDLRPYTTLSDITAVEWILIVWIASYVIEEFVQIFCHRGTGPLHQIPASDLKVSVWHRQEKMVAWFWRLDIYVRGGRWNALDMTIYLLFATAFALRFTLTPNAFQIDRVVFAVTVIFCYFRLLWYWFVLKRMGPLIIAIQMMLTELLKFLLILLVFIVSFGIAFQAILHPNQKPSGTTLVDILWRPYWQMFGELFLDDENGGMGRVVSDTSCAARTAELIQVAKSTNEHLDGVYCVEWAAPVLLGIYLLIANVLLLNLLIAIFSQAYETVKKKSETVYKFNLYGVIQECYYQTVLPPPLSLLERFVQLVIAVVRRRWCCRPEKFTEDSFRLDKVHDAIQRRASSNLKPYRQVGGANDQTTETDDGDD